MPAQKVLFFAHQGGGFIAPENTLQAFEHSLRYQPDALELDIQLTRDEEIVVMHDPLVDRTTNGKGLVSSYTWAELQQLDAGYHFTTDGGKTFPFRGTGVHISLLRTIFERFPTKLINIDLKANDPVRERKLWELIQEFHAEKQVIVGSFYCKPIQRFRKLTNKAVATGACPQEVMAFLLGHYTGAWKRLRPEYSALQVPIKQSGIPIVTAASIQTAHNMGVAVHVWTINNSAEMDRLIQLGVDGVMTDRPDILRQRLDAEENKKQ